MDKIFFYITMAAYLTGTVIYIAYLVTHREKIELAGRYALIAGFAFHTLTIASRWVIAGRTPATSFHESLTLFAWLIVAAYIVVLVKYRLQVLGAFVTPFVLLMLITASFLPNEIVPLAPALKSYWLPFHIFIAFLGHASFAIAFFLGIMYLIQNRYLKRRKLGGLYFLMPSLDVIDELNYRCITYGFVLMTLAIITGAIWLQFSMGTYWVWEHRQVWSLITWGLYAIILHGRLTSGWRGRTAAILSISAFLTIVITYFIINLLSGGAHGLANG